MITCRVCEGPLQTGFVRDGFPYHKCTVCECIMTDEIPGAAMQTQNEDPEGRNAIPHNLERWKRLHFYSNGNVDKVLDFGCGTGAFLKMIKPFVVEAIGIDRLTKTQLADVAAESIDAAVMVEVLEHLNEPRKIIAELCQKLKPAGILYIETGTVESMKCPETDSYINPRIGHSTIYSLPGLIKLCELSKCDLLIINPTTFIMRKK